MTINTGRRGGAKLRKSEAAPISRNLGRLEFVVVQEMVCSTPRKREEVPGRCSAARGLVGAGRCRSATEAAVKGVGARREERGELERTREDGLHSSLCRERFIRNKFGLPASVRVAETYAVTPLNKKHTVRAMLVRARVDWINCVT
jgi:hypothetical protein